MKYKLCDLIGNIVLELMYLALNITMLCLLVACGKSKTQWRLIGSLLINFNRRMRETTKMYIESISMTNDEYRDLLFDLMNVHLERIDCEERFEPN